MVIAVCLLAVIAFRFPGRRPRIAYSGFTAGQEAPPAPRIRSGYKMFETEIDASKIEAILTKNWNEGAWELATAPIYTPGPNAKVIPILVQRW
jgi:hypothetical protein